MPKVFKPTENAVSTGVKVFKPTENARGTGAVIVSPEKTTSNPLLQTPATKVLRGDISLQQGINEAKKQEELRTTIPSRTYSPNTEVSAIDKIFLDDAKSKLVKGETLNASERDIINKYGLYGVSTLQTNEIFDLFSNDNPKNTERFEKIKLIKAKEDKGQALTEEEKDLVETTKLINSLKKGYVSNLITLTDDINQNGNNAAVLGAMDLYNDAAYNDKEVKIGNQTFKVDKNNAQMKSLAKFQQTGNKMDLYVNTGLSQYVRGVENTFDVIFGGVRSKEMAEKPDSKYSIASNALRQYYLKNDKQANIAIQDVVTNVAQNAIPMITAALTAGLTGGASTALSSSTSKVTALAGKVLGQAPQIASQTAFAASCFGNSYEEASKLMDTPNDGRVFTYTMLTTGSELFLNAVFDLATYGGAKLAGYEGPKNLTSNIIENISSSLKNPYAKAATYVIGSGLGEFPEEFAQAILAPVLQKYVLGIDVDTVFDNPIEQLSSAAYEGFIGFLSGTLMGIGNASTGFRKASIQDLGNRYNNIFAKADIDVKNIAQYFIETAEKGSDLFKKSQEVLNGNKSDIAVGEMMNEALKEIDNANDIIYTKIGENVNSRENGVYDIISEYEKLSENGFIFPSEVTELYENITSFGIDDKIPNKLMGQFSLAVQTYTPRALIMKETLAKVEEQNPSLQNGDDSAVVEDAYNADLSESEQRLVDTPDSELTPEQRAVKQNILERQQKNITVLSDVDSGNVIDLSTDNELSVLLGDLKGANKYKKIRDYIFGLLGGRNIELSDGKNAIVDKSDALHIANKSGTEKTAQISKIKEIIQSASLYAEDNDVEHNKFNSFCYYQTTVKYGDEIFPIYINVGKAINDGKYHIYDITKKIRDTAHRVNDVERPKPNEGYALENGISNTKVPQKVLGVKTIISNSEQNNTQADPNGPANFMPDGESEGEVGRADGEIADFGGIDTAKGKHLNKAQQDEITAIGEKLGRKVVYEDFYRLDKFKGKKKIPDGYLAKDGTVHINYYAKRPVYFLFKHEITHYLKRSLASYNDFMNLVIDSNAFKDWLNRNGYSSIDTLKTEIMDTYSEVEDFDESRCYDEILANFVGEYLFGGENTVSQKLINALEPKQKKTFREVISDIINYFKSKFQKNKPIQTEIDKIENEFIKVYKEAVEVKTDEVVNIEEQYAIYNHRGNLVEVDWDSDNFSSLSQQLQNHLEEVNSMQPVDSISFKATTGKNLYTQVFDAFKKFGFKVDVQNFGTIELNEEEIRLAINGYINTDAEAAALLSIPRVLKRGKIISGHQNHKNRNYPTITFAAPVELNGKVGNVVVAVKVTGKTRYNAHRVLMPDGTEFVLDKEKNTESQLASVTYKNEGQRFAKDSVSNNKLTQPELIVKDNISEDGENYSIPSSTNAESLLESYENGEISRQEYLNALRKEKALNPLEIANLSERDADTTPEHAKKKGESKGNGESNTYNSLLESDIFDDTFKKEMKESSFVKKYETVTNEETLKIAAKELDEGGLSYVNKWWNTKPERASLVDTAVGFILIDRYQRVGDYQSAVAAAEKVREFGTTSGQQVQIFSVLGRLDPNTMVVYAQKELSKAFDEMVKTRTQKWIDKNADKFNLTDNELEFIRRRTLQAAKLPEGRDKAIKLAEIATLLQDKLPPQKGEGLKTLQRMSMLLNAKTNIRNITGNGVMVPVFIFSDFFGSGIDKWVSTKTGVRTTGNFDVKSAKGLKKGAFETMDDFRRHVNTRNSEMNRFEIGSGKAFDEHHDGKFAKQLNEVAKVLNALDRFTSFCLEMGDRPFYEMWFINSLNNQMKLNNVSEATSEMVAIASLEALQRTWQDTNKVVKAVAGTKNTLNYISIGGYGLGDVLIKFTKTPANLTKAIFDFSPAGLIKSIASDGLTLRNAVKKGSFKPKMQKQFVDSLSKGITGTLLYILAASLASAGVLGGGGDEDKDISDFEKYIQGIPEYSFKFAGKWWSYEWMQPVGAIAATVSDYMKSKENNPDNNFFENILEAIKAGGEVLYNQSFMKSIQNLFTADNIVDGLLDAILDDPSVYVPQLLSQVANVTDEYRRTTYEKDKPLQSALNRVKVKIPVLRQTLPKSVDVLGREIPNSQKGVFNAFFNPANTFTDTSTPVTDHVYELYTKTKNKTLIPRVAPYSVTVKSITKNFTPEEKNDFQRIAGATASDILEIAFKSNGYKKLSDEQKVDFINDVYGFATKMAKSSIEYDYATLSAMVGEYYKGKPILSESDYKKLPEEAREMLAQQYFFNKTEIRFLDDYKALIQWYIKQAEE